ncbi:site-2 protease family protein, partial [Candidatus Roizmanbacteria bacterium]|nr:site-2 protease family protein [Candidatus Roizmanbacteria bacterium]
LLLSLLLKLLIFFDLGFLKTIGFLLFPPIISLNIILGVFNLLPIHPLDGFKIVGGLLPDQKAREWYELERYGLLFLLLLIIPLGRTSMLDLVIRPVITFLLGLLIPTSLGGVI